MKKIKKILGKVSGISKAIRVFESPYYVFDNLSVLSIYSEVLGLGYYSGHWPREGGKHLNSFYSKSIT